MGDKMVFDYFYGAESEQFSFYRIPKLLISDRRFSSLSSDAKLLYGLMLECMSLSRRNNWFDEENRAFINYTVENVMDDLGCANGKACKLISQLENIGLIERIKPGLGKPARIYVKDFMSIFDRGKSDEIQIDGNVEEESQWEGEKTVPIQEELDEKKPANALEFTDVRKSHVKECENRTSGDAKTARQEMRKPHVRRCENRTSRNAKIARK